jgi:uncharacterized protein (DUF2147 family)
MKHYILLLLFTVSVISINAQSDKSNLIIGKWLNSDKDEIVEITLSNNTYDGHIVWLKLPNDKNGNPKLDTNNPNKKLRKKPVFGSQNIFGLQYKNEEWKNGSIYSHKRGGTINFKVISISETELIIKISKFFFSKEITYTKAK